MLVADAIVAMQETGTGVVAVGNMIGNTASDQGPCVTQSEVSPAQ
jgi:hypothetical protein